MRRLLTACALLAVVTLVPSTAAASALLDPIIGVRGLGIGDSALITDPSQQPFVGCNPSLGLPTAYICSDYEITPQFAGGVFSLDLQFFDNGTPIPVGLLSLDPLSGFNQLSVVDPFTIRLSGGAAAAGALSCGAAFSEVFAGPGFIPCTSGNDAVVFISDANRGPGPFTVSVTAVNAPEPGTLVLVGTGLVAAARRRLRKAV